MQTRAGYRPTHSAAASFLLLTTLTAPGAALAQQAPGQEVAPPPPSPTLRADLSREWEDVLLLEALRHLRLSPTQLQGVSPLSNRAERRLAELLEGSRRTRASLERILTKDRRALLKGQRMPTTDQEQLLFLRNVLRERDTFTANAIVNLITPDFARILLGEQAARAFRLTRAEWPEGVARSPSLLDPESGFVLTGEERERWQEDSLRQALSRRYPPALVARGPLASPITSTRMVDLTAGIELTARTLSLTLVGDRLVVKALPATEPAVPAPPNAARLVAAARADLEALRSHPDSMLDAWAEEATEEQFAEVLCPLARRLFFSKRLAPVLEDRLADTPVEKASGDPSDRWEDVLLLDAFRYYRLTKEQLKQVQELAEWTEEQMATFQAKAVPGREHLFRTAHRYREALLHGQPVPAADQAATLKLEETLRIEERNAQEALVLQLAQRLGHLLARWQIARAAKLAFNEWPRQEAKGILLLERESGFVLEGSDIDGWRDAAQRALLLKKYPKAVVDSLISSQRDTSTFHRFASTAGIWLSTNATSEALLSIARDSAEPRKPSPFSDKLQQAFDRDRDLLNQRWNGLSDLLEAGATRDEVECALRPLVRRLFLSPRFRPTLTERLGFPEGPREEPARPE